MEIAAKFVAWTMPMPLRVCSTACVRFSHIADVRRLSRERIETARSKLGGEPLDGLDVVGFGSLARREMTEDDLAKQFTLTPLERLVQGHDRAPANVQAAMTGVLQVVDTFMDLSADNGWRKMVKQGRPGSTDQPEFDEMRAQADVLQQHLETIFFGWELIRARSLRTLVF